MEHANSTGYKIRDNGQIHFITFAVVEWVDVFTRKDYAEIVINSLQHCQENKGLELYAWCLMSNHLHLLASTTSKEILLSDILRDFKKFTSKQIIQAIKDNPKESRKTWMLNIFEQAGAINSRNKNYQFWRQENHPVEVYSLKFITQKLQYIHNNPVAAGLVSEPKDYNYSSAKNYAHQKGMLDVLYI
jgi:putative transposase